MIDVALFIGLITVGISVLNLRELDNTEPIFQFIAGCVLVGLCLTLGDQSVFIKNFAQWVLR